MSYDKSPAKVSIPSCDSYGVKVFGIEGRLYRERERLRGMTDEERAWRAQWVKDQILAHDEPRRVPELENAVNPLRRAYMWPLKVLVYKPLLPVIGHDKAFFCKNFLGKFFMFTYAILGGTYYFKYNSNDWTRLSGWRVSTSGKAVFPGEPGYPKVSEKTRGDQYCTLGFDKSPI